MLHSILQVWGGAFYLLQKIFLSAAERSGQQWQRRWRIWSWIVYLIGLPAWVAIFASPDNRNWIAAAVETAGAPSMLVGLIIALRGHGHQPRWLDHLAKVMIVIGLGFSLYDFGGITTINQVCELALAAGFLGGTYLLAIQRPAGYLWFMLMNAANAVLMLRQDYFWLTIQQLASLAFIIDAYRVQRKKIVAQ